MRHFRRLEKSAQVKEVALGIGQAIPAPKDLSTCISSSAVSLDPYVSILLSTTRSSGVEMLR